MKTKVKKYWLQKKFTLNKKKKEKINKNNNNNNNLIYSKLI